MTKCLRLFIKHNALRRHCDHLVLTTFAMTAMFALYEWMIGERIKCTQNGNNPLHYE